MKYIITEHQEKLLQEFMQDGFSLAQMHSLAYADERVAYCKKYLGEPIGAGTSRIAFEIGDDTVIKLCRTFFDRDISQNRLEWHNGVNFTKKFPTLFPRVYQRAKDYSWIIVERVLPFKHEDCIALLGIPYSSSFGTYAKDYNRTKNGSDDHIGYQKYMNPKQISAEIEFNEDEMVDISLIGFIDWAERRVVHNTKIEEDEQYFDLMEQIPWLKQLYGYASLTCGTTDLFDDNFGLALRNGKPQIVILDSGWDELRED